MKEEERLDGKSHLPRSTIKMIRGKIRRDRMRSKKRSQKALGRNKMSMMEGQSTNAG